MMFSPSETEVEVGLSFPFIPLNVVALPAGKAFEVDWEIKDGSRTAGFPLQATANLMAYNFTDWKFLPVGEEKIIVGDDSPWKKYHESGTWAIITEQTKAVARYSCFLAGKSRSKEKTESGSFYAAGSLPEANPRNQQIKLSAARWIAGRLERGLLLRTLGEIWPGSDSSGTTDLDKARKQTEETLKMLFGFSTQQEYAAGNGYQFLEIAGLDFLATPLLVPGGAVYEAYNWGKWGEKTIKGTDATWKEIFARNNVKQILTANDDGFGKALFLAAESCRDEAEEAMKIMYEQPNDPGNVWLEKILTERSQLKNVSIKAEAMLPRIRIAAEKEGLTENDKVGIAAFVNSIKRIASTEALVLEQALTSN